MPVVVVVGPRVWFSFRVPSLPAKRQTGKLETLDVDLDQFGAAVEPQAPAGPTSARTPRQMFTTAGIP